MILGIPDPIIWIGYLLVISGAILCVVYGIINQNKGEVSDKELEMEKKWREEEIEIDEEVSEGGLK